MINFAFYQKMRPILKDGAFNPADYTPEELRMLFESLPVIKSKYCNETFRLGALEYLREHKAEYPHAHQLALKDKFNPPSQSFLPSLVAKYSSLDEALAELYSLKVESEGELVFVRTGSYELTDYSRLKKDLLIIYSNRDLYLNAIELSEYYCKWLCTQKGFSEEYFHNLTEIIKFSNNIETLELILRDNNISENCKDILDIKQTFKVTHGFKNFNLLSRNEKEFWSDLIALKGLEGLKLALNAYAELDSLREYFFSISSHQEDFTANDETGSAEPRKINWETIKVTKDNVDKFCDEIKKATTSYYDSVVWPEDNKGLDFAKLRELAKKYEMPSDLLQKLLDEEFPKFETQKDNVRDILVPVFENIKIDSTYKPGKVEESEVSFALKKALTGKSNNLKVILQPKTSPTGLFVGKMTDCCQFYTGHASEKLVMPVYTDPNAGLITINQGSEVIAESFAYLTQNASGAVDGLVLEAFTDRHAKGALLPLLKTLAKGLAQNGLKLYLGAHYNAKLSIIEEGGATTNAPILDMQKPATETYEPYAHSSGGVYFIDPETDYQIAFLDNDEEIAKLDDFLFAIPDDIAIKLKELPEIMKEILYTDPSLHRFLPSLSVETIDLLKFWNENSDQKINSGNLSGILNLFSIIPKEFFETHPISSELVSHLGEFLKTGISHDLIGITADDLETLIYWNTHSDQKVTSSNFKQVLALSASVPSETFKDIAELPSSLQWADILKDGISVIATSYTHEEKQKLKIVSNLFKFYQDPSRIEINKLILNNCSEEELSKLDKLSLNIYDMAALHRIKAIFALPAEGQIDAITNGQNGDLFVFNQALKTYINKTKDTFSAEQIMDFVEIIHAYPFIPLSYAKPEEIEELNLHKLIQIVHMKLDSETSFKLYTLIQEGKTDFASVTPDNLSDFIKVEAPSSAGCASEAASAGCASAPNVLQELLDEFADSLPPESDVTSVMGDAQ